MTARPMGFDTDLVEMITREVSLDPSIVIEPDTDLLLTGLVDSLGVVEIVGWIEDRLGLTVAPADVVLEHFQTVRLMLDYLDRRLAG
ncbi:MAG: acyl carrier protein [Actinomycetes bacterium]